MIDFKKSAISILISLIFALPLAGCGKEISNINVKPEEMLTLSDGIIDSNENYILSWDDAKNNILLKSTKNNNVWSTVPYDFYLSEDTNVNLNAPMFITYYNPADSSLMTAKAYADCIELGNLSVSSEKGKIKMKFYFEAAEITVPLEISLTEKGMQASVKAADIEESGKTRLIDVSVLPYMCSAPNSKDKSSYLFVPTGCGALLYTDEEVQEFSREYTGEVYGTDGSRYILDNPTNQEPILLPVYGVKNKDSALFAIIENGSEAAKITANSGNSRNGYSSVYATFFVRGNDETEVERTNYSDAFIFSEKFDKNAVYTVNYYPLFDESADYSGMAEFYKEYLKEKNSLRDSKLSQQPYHLTFLGGSLVREVAVGIPYKKIKVATTINQAEDIVDDLIKETQSIPSVTLKGYSDDGLDIGRIAGGYTISSMLGGKKDYKSFDEYCKTKGINLFFEYDLVRFNSSDNGFSTFFDISKTAGNQLAAFYPLNINIRNANKGFKKYGLLKRSLLEDAVDKLLKKCDYVSGLSLTTLGNIAYSDYSKTMYYAKSNMSVQVQDLINKVQSQGHNINMGAANGYAAQMCDSITDVPLNHGDYFAFDERIPFYQIVFRGSSAMYSTPMNLSVNSAKDILRAIESGVSPSFVLTNSVSTALADTQSGEYYASVYEGYKEEIIEIVDKTAEYYSLIADSSIKSHGFINDYVTVTEFLNGITVWVNHSEEEVKINNTVLEGLSFCYSNNGKIHSFEFGGR